MDKKQSILSQRFISARKLFQAIEREVNSIAAAGPPRKHMKRGISCHVEKVTKQARIIYNIEGGNIYILHCFRGHKEYERWYNSYK
jgi:hypothetical protein